MRTIRTKSHSAVVIVGSTFVHAWHTSLDEPFFCGAQHTWFLHTPRPRAHAGTPVSRHKPRAELLLAMHCDAIPKPSDLYF